VVHVDLLDPEELLQVFDEDGVLLGEGARVEALQIVLQ
jgi:hypothetical protein